MKKRDSKTWLQRLVAKKRLNNVIEERDLKDSAWNKWVKKVVEQKDRKHDRKKKWKGDWKKSDSNKWFTKSDSKKKNVRMCFVVRHRFTLHRCWLVSVARQRILIYPARLSQPLFEPKQETSSIRVIALHRFESSAHVKMVETSKLKQVIGKTDWNKWLNKHCENDGKK